MDWQDQLIALYCFACNQYCSELHIYCKRFTNYADLVFSDEAMITLSLFGVIQKRKQVKKIYTYAAHQIWMSSYCCSCIIYMFSRFSLQDSYPAM